MHAEKKCEPCFASALRESNAYASNKPRAIPAADSPNRPALEFLFKYALWVRARRPAAKRFTYEGIQYGIVWAGRRMCVMHMPSARIIVGAPGVRGD